MSTKAQVQARRAWIKHGLMNGDNDAVIAMLRDHLPETTSMDANQLKQFEIAKAAMSELWLRGISKRTFISRAGLTKRPSKRQPRAK